MQRAAASSLSCILRRNRVGEVSDPPSSKAVLHTTSRSFGVFFEEWDVILTPITALPTPKVGTPKYLTISDIHRYWIGSAIYGATSPSRRLPVPAASPREAIGTVTS